MRERGVRDGDGRKGGSENKKGDGREGKTEIEGEKNVVWM